MKNTKKYENQNLLKYSYAEDRLDVQKSKDQFEGALLLGAIGDALGWPTEFIKPNRSYRLPFNLPIEGFVKWRKLVGGRWWGYHDDIGVGEYSDDTQLTLAVARCISDAGLFEPEMFAYWELPLWLHYQRGGGRSVKTAARSMIKGKAEWYNNFYKLGDIDYRNAGANGAAMRNLPIALVNSTNEYQLIVDSILNTIITHGHPRAILATILYSASIRFSLTTEKNVKGMLEYLKYFLNKSLLIVEKETRIQQWIDKWETIERQSPGSFLSLYRRTIDEINTYLDAIPKYLEKSEDMYYKLIGAFNPSSKGSGTVTVCCAIYLFLKNCGSIEDSLLDAANLIGSDTDTICSFLGGLLGSNYGRKEIPGYLEIEVQDFEYLVETGQRLFMISTGNVEGELDETCAIERKQGLLKILTWEIGLHEMFWDAINEGGVVVHPTLGKGVITHKTVEEIQRKEYLAKLLRVNFDCGQTCIFHSRVKKDGNVSESLAREIEKFLYKK